MPNIMKINNVLLEEDNRIKERKLIIGGQPRYLPIIDI